MKFAPVLPPELYPLLDTGDYHLVQAHHIVGNRRISEWFDGRARTGGTVILDNGACELGEADVQTLFRVAKEIRPTIIVCPDSFQNAGKTLNLQMLHFLTCLKHAHTVMIVPQGKDVDEWVRCAQEMINYANRQTIHRRTIVGVPKVLDSYDGCHGNSLRQALIGGRNAALAQLFGTLRWPQGRTHLLGVWGTVRIVLELAVKYPNILSLDSSLPFATALCNFELTPDSYKVGLDANDFKMTADIKWDLHARAQANIERMRTWLK